MKFSQRIGKTPSTKSIQLNSVDEELKIGLWNLIKLHFLNKISKKVCYGDTETDFDFFSKKLYQDFYVLPIDIIPANDFDTEKFIREKFFDGRWYDIYDFVEFLTMFNFYDVNIYDYIEDVNRVLEKEFSGYRFIKGVIAPISNKIEIQEVEQAIDKIKYFTTLEGSNIHLTKSLEKISEKKNPDFRNSIKESISAVETTCRILTKESTLGRALKALEKKEIKIDDQLKDGFEKIYAYTNNKVSGIRHAIIEEHKAPDFNDAKYMLVACSSFINYLVGKCQSSGIKIN